MGIVATDRVSVVFQVILVVIPIADIFGYLRIKKLRYAILFIYLPAAVTGFITPELYPEQYGLFDEALFELIDRGSYDVSSRDVYDAIPVVILEILIAVAFLAWSIFLMYRWADKWNKNYDFIS